MSEKGSDRAYELWREAAERFDYFLTGLAAALVGYLAPTIQPAKLEWSPAMLEVLAVLVLVFSVFAGFKRIEATVHLLKVGSAKLAQLESIAVLDAARQAGTPVQGRGTGVVLAGAAIQKIAETHAGFVVEAKALEKATADRASLWYTIRYITLIGGFLLILAGKVWQGYL